MTKPPVEWDNRTVPKVDFCEKQYFFLQKRGFLSHDRRTKVCNLRHCGGGGVVVWHLENIKKPLEVKYVR